MPKVRRDRDGYNVVSWTRRTGYVTHQLTADGVSLLQMRRDDIEGLKIDVNTLMFLREKGYAHIGKRAPKPPPRDPTLWPSPTAPSPPPPQPKAARPSPPPAAAAPVRFPAMPCPRCAEPCPLAATFCGRCGLPLKAGHRRREATYIIALLVVIVVLLAWAVFR